MNTFGATLSEARLAAGLSLRAAAKALGVSHVYLRDVELGECTPLARERWPDVLKLYWPHVAESALERGVAHHYAERYAKRLRAWGLEPADYWGQWAASHGDVPEAWSL